jgi:hypothetical protein
MSRDLPCVYRAATLEEAEAFAVWLEEQGVAAFVKDRYAVGTLGVPAIAAPRGVEVCVNDEATAERGRALAQAFIDQQARHAEAVATLSPVTLTCPGCGKAATFPTAQRGQVAKCPHCDAFVDVPDGAPQ